MTPTRSHGRLLGRDFFSLSSSTIVSVWDSRRMLSRIVISVCCLSVSDVCWQMLVARYRRWSVIVMRLMGGRLVVESAGRVVSNSSSIRQVSSDSAVEDSVSVCAIASVVSRDSACRSVCSVVAEVACSVSCTRFEVEQPANTKRLQLYYK